MASGDSHWHCIKGFSFSIPYYKCRNFNKIKFHNRFIKLKELKQNLKQTDRQSDSLRKETTIGKGVILQNGRKKGVMIEMSESR